MKDENMLKVVVVSTISSGKSTFINSLIGKSLLPSKNQVCTSRILEIVNNNDLDNYIAHITLKDGYRIDINVIDESIVEKYNSSELVDKVVIEGKFDWLNNYNYGFKIIDTPGINNSKSQNDYNTTFNYLDFIDKGLIVFVINATQIGTNDEKKALLEIKEKLNKNKDIKIIFVVNKMDSISRDKECPIELVKNINIYLNKLGFSDFKTLATSSGASLIFKKFLNNETLTINEQIEFLRYYELFSGNNFDLEEININSYKNEYTLFDKIYKNNEVRAALKNTGIHKIENELLINLLLAK